MPKKSIASKELSLADQLAAIEELVKDLQRERRGLIGVDDSTTYRKQDFLIAADICERTYQSWRAFTSFVAICREAPGTPNIVYINGKDFNEWLRRESR